MRSDRVVGVILRNLECQLSCHHCCSTITVPSSTWAAPCVPPLRPTPGFAIGTTHAYATSATAVSTASAAQPAAAPPLDQSAAEPPTPTAAAAEVSAAAPVPRAVQQQLRSREPAPSFQQLQEVCKQRLNIKRAVGESKLVDLVQQASTADQVQSALDLVLWDKMVRMRLNQYKHLSPIVINALLKASSRADLGPKHGVMLLQRANELGLQVSLSVCESVLQDCLKHGDYWAAAEAWIYTQVHLGDTQPAAHAAEKEPDTESKQAEEQHQEQQTAQVGRPNSPLSWASNSLLRLYAKGLVKWIHAGGVTPKHQQHLEQQWHAVTDELKSRGARVPEGLPSRPVQPEQEAQPDSAEEQAATQAADNVAGA